MVDAEKYLLIAQAVEAKVLKTFQCGFEAHSGDFSQLPIPPSKETLQYIKDKYFYEGGKVFRVLKNGYSLKELGTYSPDTGYYHIDIKHGRLIKGKRMKRSHIVWFLNKKEWPTQQLDHKDRNKINDAIDNLRLVTSKINSQNTVNCDTIKLQIRRAKKKQRIDIRIKGYHIYVGVFYPEDVLIVAKYICDYLNNKNYGVTFYV